MRENKTLENKMKDLDKQMGGGGWFLNGCGKE